MIGNGADAPDDAGVEHGPQPRHDFLGGNADLLADQPVGAGRQRQAALRGDNQCAVDGIELRRVTHARAASFISTKYSRSLGKA